MSLLERHNWTAPVDFIISDIYEYDMKRGGLSIIKQKNLLPQETINELDRMEKHTADITIGNKMRYQVKGLSQQLTDGFKEYRLRLGEANNLTDDDIVSVKKDAVFSKKYCSVTQFDDFIEFREKHQYQAMLRLPPNIEIYWTDNLIDVKGIQDTYVNVHSEYLLKDIGKIIKALCEYDKARALKILVKLMDQYKFRELPVGYYREFTGKCEYVLDLDGTIVMTQEVSDDMIPQLYIQYNYVNVLVPLLKILMS